MRCLLFFFLLAFVTVSQAQTFAPVNLFNSYNSNILFNSHHYDSTQKKLFLTHYAGASAGYIFFQGRGAGYVAAPITFQLNRELNNNLYAFANVSVAPAYISFNQAFLNTNVNKIGGTGFYKANNLSLQSSATLGLMYINNNKTFSISGGITVERNNFPAYYPNQFQSANNNNGKINYR